MAGLFDAMNTSVTGLTAQATAMGNISNNIANAQTTGYKADDTSFADLVNQSGLTSDGGGAGAIAISGYDVASQGTLTATNTATNLGISGNGFFAVESGSTNASGGITFTGNQEYTRRGDFSMNAQGYLVNGVGSYLEGYAVSPSTNTVDTSALVPIQISHAPNAPVATSSVSLDANLPSNAASGSTLSPTTLQVYDANGNSHSIQLNWTQTGTGQWAAEMKIPDAVGGFDNTLDLGFGTGAAGTTSGTIQSMANASGSTAFTVPTGAAAAAGKPAQASFTVDFGSGPQTISLNLGTFNQATGLTQFSSSDQQVDVSSVNQNGLPQGNFQNVSIDQSGNVAINYSNGQSQTVYQVPLATFSNPDGLQADSGGVWSQTQDSGTAHIGSAGLNGAGSMQSGETENSNVDLTGEFTKMIQTQQVYSANSRAITTANQMLEDLLSIVHP